MARNLPRLRQYITVFHGPSFPWVSVIENLEGLVERSVSQPEQLYNAHAAILVLDSELLKVAPFEAWAPPGNDNIIVICEESQGEGDYIVPNGWPKRLTGNALQGALAEWTLRLSRRSLRDELVAENAKISQLTGIAQDLSAETNLDKLLTKILYEGRALACCDAASLFLIDHNERGEDEMVFKLSQNDSMPFPFEEKRFALDTRSIAGFVAVTGEICNIPDVYMVDGTAPYVFNRSFDELNGYRTRSMITIPMMNHEKEKKVIGVLQFINRKTSSQIKLTNADVTLEHTLPFSEDLADLLLALASQAAIAIENANLIAQVHMLFEGFVKASVTAIEQRDPTTSGHSFRVANLTTSLALAAPRSGVSRFRDLTFDDQAIREIRYASLLHDFGKVGVREHVLVKANKLPERGLDLIRMRFMIFKERLRANIAEERLAYVLKHGRDAYFKVAAEFEQRLQTAMDRFSFFYDEIAAANKPSILAEERCSHLVDIHKEPNLLVDGEELTLLTDEELAALSVKRGSLTSDERREIESHVRHTFEFLSRIPWTPDLKRAPEFAYAHHEKLDGSGYPRGLKDKQIPLPSKMMTVADIYDALTASDRPYKPAVPRDRALDILIAEANRGFLDNDLVNIFIEAKIYENAEDPADKAYAYSGFTDRFIKRNTCDYDLEEALRSLDQVSD